ncbi:MFS transporter [Jatrophihabitans sp. YIM 134969]
MTSIARASSALSELRHATFASLSIPNYRRYVAGQSVSLVGTWMQTVAQSWLVFTLTHSATAVGFAVALQTIPVLVLGPYAGVVADRVDKRRLMMALQAVMGLLALALGLLTITGAVAVWQVYLLAVALGLNNAFENPARQSFVLELVGADALRNAVSLNSVLVNVARAVGPAVAGLIIAAGGIGVCFLLNAVSFAAVVASLARLDTTALRPSRPAARAKGQLREGLAHVRGNPELAVPLLMMALIGCLAYEFSVTLPIVASQTFGQGAELYGWLTASMGVGAVVGGLWVAGHGRTGARGLVGSAAAFAVVLLAAALAPSPWLAVGAMALVGAASIAFTSVGNSTIQLAAAPEMRGRVMALWATAFLGTTPIGGPVAGWVAETWGGRAGLVLGAAACALAALLGLVLLRRGRRRVATPAVAEPVAA